jgi:histidinol-phosphate aminotransferase
MSRRTLSRRQFSRAIGAAVGATLVAPKIFERAGSALAEQRASAAAPAVRIELNSNENPYGAPPKALEAIARSRNIAARYPDAIEGRMVEVIARYHRVDPSNVLLGCGSGEILRVAANASLSPGRNVVVAEPTFEAVLAYARVTTADPVKVPLTPDHRHDLPRMLAACNDRTGLVYICNPNNPTGTIVTRDELAKFLAAAPRTATILVDEAYHHFVEDPRYASTFDWFGKYPNLVLVRTFSKIYGMAGMRLGYAVAAPDKINAMRPYVNWNNANTSVLEAALACFGDDPWVAAERKRFNDTRRWLCREFEKEGRRYIPSETNFVMVDVGGDVTPVIQKFREKNIFVGRKFPSLPNWLRISIGTPEEMQAFAAALREIVPARA